MPDQIESPSDAEFAQRFLREAAPEAIDRAIFDGITVRGVDEEKRTATFAAATENGVLTYGGKEYLRMSGLTLKRFRKNPVILDSHRRESIEDVIGRGSVKVEGRELIADITFAKTDRAEKAWHLVRDGMVHAVSVGFMADRSKIKALVEGEVDGDAPNQIVGPARVIKGWELYEISLVPVPADQDALKRSFLPVEKAADLGPRPKKEDARMAAEQTPAPAPAPAPKETEQNRQDELTEEREARKAKAIREQVMAFVPESLREYADGLILEGKSVEDIRKALLEKRAADQRPAGTPEPKAEDKAEEKTEISDEVLVRSLCAPRIY